MPVSIGRRWPRDSLILPPGEIFIVKTLGWDTAGIWWVEARGPAQQPPGPRMTPLQRTAPGRSRGLVLVQVWGQLGSARSALGLPHLPSPLACRMAVTLAVSCCEDWTGAQLNSWLLPTALSVSHPLRSWGSNVAFPETEFPGMGLLGARGWVAPWLSPSLKSNPEFSLFLPPQGVEARLSTCQMRCFPQLLPAPVPAAPGVG